MLYPKRLSSLLTVFAMFFAVVFVFGSFQDNLDEDSLPTAIQQPSAGEGSVSAYVPSDLASQLPLPEEKRMNSAGMERTSPPASRGMEVHIPELQPDRITALINDDNTNFRNYPDLSSDVTRSLKKGLQVNVLGRWNDWYKVEVDTDVSGWVHKDLLDSSNLSVAAGLQDLNYAIPVEKPKDVIPRGQKVVNYAKRYMGIKYVWGGTSPKGFDCSGLVQYVYRYFGVRLERVASDQARQGIAVKRNSLKAGDLVFFDTNGGNNYINHVGIYIGNGKFIEAVKPRIRISDMSSGFYSKAFMRARRYF